EKLVEKTIQIEDVDPVALFGVNENKLKIIQGQFPKLKIVARGELLKLIGDEAQVHLFEEKLAQLIQHLLKFKQLTENNIERILGESNETVEKQLEGDNKVLVYGNNGL